jgi:hypothetical protein
MANDTTVTIVSDKGLSGNDDSTLHQKDAIHGVGGGGVDDNNDEEEEEEEVEVMVCWSLFRENTNVEVPIGTCLSAARQTKMMWIGGGSCQALVCRVIILIGVNQTHGEKYLQRQHGGKERGNNSCSCNKPVSITL